MSNNIRKDDAASFRRLATKRTNNALKHIRLIGNLSNKSNYTYAATDLKKIFDALKDGIEETENRFKEAQPKGKFSLEIL